MKHFTISMICFCCTTAAAESPMSGNEFNETTLGKTFDFALNGQVYGREFYLPNNQVIWDDLDNGPCRLGTWRAFENTICFDYQTDPGVLKCWEISPSPDGFAAQFMNDGPEGSPYEMIPTDKSLTCTSPDFGA